MLNLSLISIICKKIYGNFFHNLFTAHWDSKYVRKVNKKIKNGVSMLYVTLIVNQIYVKCSWHIEYDPKKTKPKKL